MSEDPVPTVCIACSIFRSELRALEARGELSVPVRFLPSMLHLEPEALERRLGDELDSAAGSGERALVLYGDCHHGMLDQVSRSGVARVQGLNCPEILLGRERYRALRKEGVFFLMPEWTIRWREIFVDDLGLNREVAQEFMREFHTRLLYLDTGVMPFPEEHLEAVSDHTGLPWTVERVEPDRLGEAVRNALRGLAGGG